MSDPLPIGIPVSELRPTQMTVGFREVELKRRRWRDADEHARTKILRSHVVPAVIGPKGRFYIVDHHHFAKALLEEHAGPIAVYILADLTGLPKKEFWTFLDNNDWCHAYDAAGKRCALGAIPTTLAALADDPYRSLVGELVRAGGCAKSSAPFFEFLWADFLRRRIKAALVNTDFNAALKKAMKLAKASDAKSLPGWAGAEHHD
jgi:hypothetical protein